MRVIKIIKDDRLSNYILLTLYTMINVKLVLN